MTRRLRGTDTIPGAVSEALQELGSHVATARLRRRWRQQDLAAKAGITDKTLRNIEAGAPGTSLAAYASVLWALSMLDHLQAVAAPNRDAEGETLAAARLGERVRPTQTVNDAF